MFCFSFHLLSIIITLDLFWTASISLVKLANLLNNLILRSINFPVLAMTLFTESRLSRSFKTSGMAISSPILKIAIVYGLKYEYIQVTSS